MEHCDILIIGGGAAGIAAAKACGGARVILVDRGPKLGGVLLQCAHRGFDQNLSGPEFTEELLADFPEDIRLYLNTTVVSLSEDKTAVLVGPDIGRKTVSFRQLILATGCREIPAGALPMGGTRPRGIYTAGQMQQMMNLHGFAPEGPVVILGSGDIGLVMAKQIAQTGIRVTLIEKSDRCGGSARNQRCLEEYPIELFCGDTVAEVCGYPALTGCVTEQGRHIPCRTLLIAVGLLPERELVRELEGKDWLHICGNCNTVHPIVEAVVIEGEQAGNAAWEKIRGSL